MATPPQATPPSEATQAPVPTASTTVGKPIHSLVLDTGPLIKNDPSVSALIAQAEQLYILPSVVPEIRDVATRTRVETTLLPFVTLRAPNPKSVAVIREFARKTGDLGVLSRPDIEVLALGYELECERNGGDWRLRRSPDQKQVNGKPPQRTAVPSVEATTQEGTVGDEAKEAAPVSSTEEAATTAEEPATAAEVPVPAEEAPVPVEEAASPSTDAPVEAMEKLDVSDATETQGADESSPTAEPEVVVAEEVEEEDASDDGEASDDDGGWITPSNVKKHKNLDANTSTPSKNATAPRTLQAAVLTSDYAMQNVALRMNLNLVTPAFARITHLKTWVLRCHGCFKITKDMEKQFCPSCGQPTLLRTSCSTDDKGNFRVHLKKGFQYNNRGNVYSVPKPVHGTPHGRLAKGAGGQNHWGVHLMLAEDQKEFVKASEALKKQKKKDLMDDEFLPGILTGDRSSGGKIKVGAGRTINARRRR